MAEEDSTEERRLHGEDQFLKQAAETLGNMSNYSTYANKDDVHPAGGFWSHLELEDKDIQQALTGEQDLTRYQKLTKIQDEQVVNAVKQMENPAPLHNKGNHTWDFEAKIHEPWAAMVAK